MPRMRLDWRGRCLARFVIDPAYLAQVRKEQDLLRAGFSSTAVETKTCPYCGHKAIRIAQGTKGYIFTKCRKCNEEVLFSFRRGKWRLVQPR